MNELEKDIAEVKADIRDIKDNHLTEIRDKISKLKTSIAWVKGALWTLVPMIAVILSIMIYLLVR